eukprot:574483-Pelagomonas_calceolata.AAC.1
MEQNKENLALCNAIAGLEYIDLDLPLLQQIESISSNTKRAMKNIDETRNKESKNITRKQLNKMINKNPEQAHREIFRDKNAQPRAGLQALRDPGTNTIEAEPDRQAQITEKYYTEAMSAVNIKNGKYLPEEAPRKLPLGTGWKNRTCTGTLHAPISNNKRGTRRN